MAKEVYKTKSVSELSDAEAEKLVVTRFISFETIVRNFDETMRKEYGIEEKTSGYRVTNQGVEILYK